MRTRSLRILLGLCRLVKHFVQKTPLTLPYILQIIGAFTVVAALADSYFKYAPLINPITKKVISKTWKIDFENDKCLIKFEIKNTSGSAITEIRFGWSDNTEDSIFSEIRYSEQYPNITYYQSLSQTVEYGPMTLLPYQKLHVYMKPKHCHHYSKPWMTKDFKKLKVKRHDL